MDLATLYADAQTRIIDLVSPLEPPALATRVPGTPKWTVLELVYHLAGVCQDVARGNMEGAPTHTWTDRQVAAHQGRTLPDVLAEWREQAPALLALLATPGRADASAMDVLTHEHDLRGALGLSGPSDREAVLVTTARVTGRVGRLVESNGLPTLRLVSDDEEWVCGPGDGAVTGRAPTIEWFRALFGRRSSAQILTYAWDGDPEPYFGILNLFGPLPEADVAEAGAPVPAQHR